MSEQNRDIRPDVQQDTSASMNQTSSAENGETASLETRVTREVIDLLEIFVIAAAIVILLFSFVARLSVVEGPSMQKTLIKGDYLIVSDLFYTPKTGDIVVTHDVTTGHTDPLVKRVIATAGQTIDIDYENWVVTVDGQPLQEDYVNRESGPMLVRSTYVSLPYTVKEGEVFIMGDNRNHSSDSRAFGPVDERCVIGHVLLRLFPLNHFGVPNS